MISAALAAGLALTMTVTAFADEPYTAYNYDYWDDAIPSQSAYRVEKTVTGADMGLDRLSDPSDPLYISDDAPAKLSDAKDLFYDQDNDTFWMCDSGNNRILRLDTDLKVTGCYTGFTERLMTSCLSKITLFVILGFSTPRRNQTIPSPLIY